MNFRVDVRGVVQGVGFRPFVYTLANSMGLRGSVSNDSHGVVILLETTKEKLHRFTKKLKESKPPLSKIDSIEISESGEEHHFESFKILSSEESSKPTALTAPDIGMCKECKRELEDKSNRRYNYPFITCTNCGPRYTIVKKLPYDRENTSMHKFEMCKKCQDEYKDPSNRRYNAETIGCFECGPKLSLLDSKGEKLYVESVVDEVVRLLSDGNVVAIKGIGGYHLLCDASDKKSVELLRSRKKRPSKPFAVMVKDIESSRELAEIDSKEEELLESNRRPIVLLEKKESRLICDSVVPGIGQVGLFLPYTPLHSMILEKLDVPLVATSANISGEPLCKTLDDIMNLSNVWDYCLDNDRDIINSCDDSVVFAEDENVFFLRSARGYSPGYLNSLIKNDKKILSLGANQKSTVAVTLNDKVVLSPYIADLNELSSIEHYRLHIDTLKNIYEFEPDIVVCDKHPNYESSRYAKELKEKNPNIELFEVQHHYAHILATMGVNGISSKVLGVSFDGTGYGDDGNLWGGEFLLCDEVSYERIAHFKYFRLLGGEKAIKEPRRVALSFLFELYGEEAVELKNHTTDSFSKDELKLLYSVWKRGLNSPLTSSCGRLFDAVASILGLLHVSSYEGESGLILETLYSDEVDESYDFRLDNKEINFSYVFAQILEEKNRVIAVSKFFNTLVEIIFSISKKYDLPLVLGGGVFQNRILLRLLMKRMPKVIVPKEFVSNDSAISYGQMIAAQSR